MADPSDPVLKLREAAKSDPSKISELLVETALAPISPEARTVLEKRPEFSPEFLEREAKKFNLPLDQIKEIAETVISQGQPGLVVEAREFGVDAEAREHFKALYESEIKRRRRCNRWTYTPDVSGKKIKKPCGAELLTIDQALVHHSLHILFEADYRTQRSHWNDIRELLHPTQERGLRAALPQEERQRLLEDPRIRARLLSR